MRGACSDTANVEDSFLDLEWHVDVPYAAQAMLAGGEWHQLVPEGHPGLAEVKWCMNRFIPFLVVDPKPDPQPGSRDAEELSLEVRDGINNQTS